jgi:hypothetical protein
MCVGWELAEEVENIGVAVAGLADEGCNASDAFWVVIENGSARVEHT